jgi:hypothetical protein
MRRFAGIAGTLAIGVAVGLVIGCLLGFTHGTQRLRTLRRRRKRSIIRSLTLRSSDIPARWPTSGFACSATIPRPLNGHDP